MHVAIGGTTDQSVVVLFQSQFPSVIDPSIPFVWLSVCLSVYPIMVKTIVSLGSAINYPLATF